MSIAELLKKNREEAGMSPEDLAKKISVPLEVLAYLENPAAKEEDLIVYLAGALETTPEIFKGEKPPEPTEEEKKALRKKELERIEAEHRRKAEELQKKLEALEKDLGK